MATPQITDAPKRERATLTSADLAQASRYVTQYKNGMRPLPSATRPAVQTRTTPDRLVIFCAEHPRIQELVLQAQERIEREKQGAGSSQPTKKFGVSRAELDTIYATVTELGLGYTIAFVCDNEDNIHRTLRANPIKQGRDGQDHRYDKTLPYLG